MDYTRLKNCELFLFDMDGTLYLGDEVYDGARELMFDFPRMGKKYIYLTNNSSRAGEDYIHRLRRLGFPCERENVFTSGMATGLYLNQHHPGASVYIAGTKAFHRELLSYGIKLVNDELGHTESDLVDVVVQGFDTELVYEKLERACHRRQPRLGLPDAGRRGAARLRQHLRAADGLQRKRAHLYRQAQPQYGGRDLGHDGRAQ